VFDTSRLRRGELVAAVGAILLFVFLFFFKWYGVAFPDGVSQQAEALGIDLGGASVDGWTGHSVLRWLMLLTIVAALALAFLTATQRTVALPVTMAVIVTALAALLTLLLAYRVLLNEPGPNDVIEVKIGAWLGLISSAVIAYGGYLSMRDEGTTLDDVRAQASAAGQQARAAFDEGAPRSDAPASAPPPTAAPPAAAPPAAEEPDATDPPPHGTPPATPSGSAAPPAAGF
jgi:hypothetical protein